MNADESREAGGSDLRFFQQADRKAAERMATGQEIHGIFNPSTNAEDHDVNGLEEAADSINYARMEAEMLLCNFSYEDAAVLDALLQRLGEIRNASRRLGAMWAEYIEARISAFQPCAADGHGRNARPHFSSEEGS